MFVDADQPSDGIDGNTKLLAAWLACLSVPTAEKSSLHSRGVGFYNTKISSVQRHVETQSAWRRRWYPLPLSS